MMLNNRKLEQLIASQQHAVVGYLTAGYPERERFFHIVKTCAKKGLSILEIGFPSQNPYADGEVIRRAHACVDRNIKTDLSFWRRLRESVDNPIWIMGYYEDLRENDIYLKLAEEKLADAYVIPDADYSQLLAMKQRLKDYQTELVPLISDSMPIEERECRLDAFHLIYQQLYSGVTGQPVENETYKALLADNLAHGGNVIFAGFGINSPKRVEKLLSEGFYGVIIGTEIMRSLNRSEENLYQFVEALGTAAKTQMKDEAGVSERREVQLEYSNV